MLTTWANMQICDFVSTVKSFIFTPPRRQLTFLIPSGFCCKATSCSGFTIGILSMILHVMPKEKGVRGDSESRKLKYIWPKIISKF